MGIVAFLNAYFKQIRTGSASDPEDKDLRWILELLLNQVQIIYTVLTSTKVKFHYSGSLRFWLQGIVEYFLSIGLSYSVDYCVLLYFALWRVYAFVKYVCVCVCTSVS